MRFTGEIRLEQKTSQFLLRRTMENVSFGLPPRVEVEKQHVELGLSETGEIPKSPSGWWFQRFFPIIYGIILPID
jgi:hypothetical protein